MKGTAVAKKKEKVAPNHALKVNVKTNVKPNTRQKKEFLKHIQALRAMIRSGTFAACPCVQLKCEWHGRCFECVMIHRAQKNHVPECLQDMFYDKMLQLGKNLEIRVGVERTSTDEFWDFVNKVSPPKP
jgi:hypothetical protein